MAKLSTRPCIGIVKTRTWFVCRCSCSPADFVVENVCHYDDYCCCSPSYCGYYYYCCCSRDGHQVEYGQGHTWSRTCNSPWESTCKVSDPSPRRHGKTDTSCRPDRRPAYRTCRAHGIGSYCWRSWSCLVDRHCYCHCGGRTIACWSPAGLSWSRWTWRRSWYTIWSRIH